MENTTTPWVGNWDEEEDDNAARKIQRESLIPSSHHPWLFDEKTSKFQRLPPTFSPWWSSWNQLSPSCAWLGMVVVGVRVLRSRILIKDEVRFSTSHFPLGIILGITIIYKWSPSSPSFLRNENDESGESRLEGEAQFSKSTNRKWRLALILIAINCVSTSLRTWIPAKIIVNYSRNEGGTVEDLGKAHYARADLDDVELYEIF